jgi:hypothetical protein
MRGLIGSSISAGWTRAICSKWRSSCNSATWRSMASWAIRQSWGLRGVTPCQWVWRAASRSRRWRQPESRPMSRRTRRRS